MRIAIVGAGISGLATAFHLQRLQPGCELVVFDPEPNAGGTMQTAVREGFRFEIGGNGFLTNKPDTLALVEAAGATDLLLRSSDLARKRFIFNGSMHRLPESPPLFLKTKLISLPAKLRVVGELFVPARRDGAEESLRDFGYRRLGKAFTDVFLDAMVAGIYGSTPDKVCVNAAFPMVVDLEREYGGLFRGMFAKRKKEAGPGGALMSFKGGVGSFVEHLRSRVTAEWRLGEGVTAIERQGEGYRLGTAGGVTDVDQVVIAAPPHPASAMLQPLDRELAGRLGQIEASPIAVVGFGFRRLAHPLDGFGCLTTTAARQKAMGILWDSSIFPDRAPEGCKSLRVMIGGQRNPELVNQDEAGLIATAREGLATAMGITDEPDVTFVKRWDRGIPSYTVGHVARVNDLFARVAKHPGLHLNCNAYRGIALNDCTRNARELAERIAGSR